MTQRTACTRNFARFNLGCRADENHAEARRIRFVNKLRGAHTARPLACTDTHTHASRRARDVYIYIYIYTYIYIGTGLTQFSLNSWQSFTMPVPARTCAFPYISPDIG